MTCRNTAAAPGLAAGYAFNEGERHHRRRRLGHGLTGTLANGPTWVRPERRRRAIRRLNDYVNLGNPTALSSPAA